MLGRLVATVLTVTAIGVGASTVTSPALAAPGDVGYEDFRYGPPEGAGPDGFLDPNLAPTASKPQSKLWFAQGSWWGVLQVPDTHTTTIHAYDAKAHTWVDTGVVVDSRDEPTHADVLWDGSKLYVASAGRAGATGGIVVSRFRYDATQAKYVVDPGLPTDELTTSGVEAAVIAKDTTGRLWVAYTAPPEGGGPGRLVRVLASTTSQTSFPDKFTPSVGELPLDGTSIAKDDIASIIAHDGGVSLVWSNQNADAEGNTGFYVARHPDGAAPMEGWTGSQKIFTGPLYADDHINLTSVEGGSGGSVYAMIKSSVGDSSATSSSAPLVWLLVIRPDGTWQQYAHSTVKENMTRPIVVLEPSRNLLHVFATSPVEGGVIYHKTSSLTKPGFVSGKGEAFIKLAAHPMINNATSSKQNVTDASGIMVLASDQTTGNYAHNYVPRVAPQASFTWTPTSGPAPLDVQFSDTSTGAVDSWSWSFGDGGTSTAASPMHTFANMGTYTVTLTTRNAAGSTTRTATVKVDVAKPVASFTNTPATGPAPLPVQFTDTSATTGGAPTSWLWDFGDKTTSTQQNPAHTFTQMGTYTVRLTATNASGSNFVERAVVVAVAKPVASFTYTPPTGPAPLPVQFTDTSATTGGAPASWVWDFGDGTTSTQQNPTHTYAAGGTYEVSLKVDNASGSSSAKNTITIGARPVPPAVGLPVVVLDEPTLSLTTSPSIQTAWHATTAPGEVAGYEVQVREVGSSRRAQWTDQSVATTAKSLQVPARHGSTYCLQVRATNIAHQTGAWSATHCTAVPLDDRDLAHDGRWRKVSDAQDYFMGTALVARDRGAALSRSVTGTRVSLLVTKRSNGGRVLVYRNDHLVKRVSLKATTTRSMQLVTIASSKTVTTARYTVVVVSRGRPVTIDGMVVSRS
jgi:PKD repeat protein